MLADHDAALSLLVPKLFHFGGLAVDSQIHIVAGQSQLIVGGILGGVDSGQGVLAVAVLAVGVPALGLLQVGVLGAAVDLLQGNLLVGAIHEVGVALTVLLRLVVVSALVMNT